MHMSAALPCLDTRRALGVSASVLLLAIAILFVGVQQASAAPPYSISGVVTDYPAGTGIGGIVVRVISDSESNLYTGSAVTTVSAGDGSFTITGIPSEGYYHVSFIDTSDVYRDSHYWTQGVPLDSAVPIWVDEDEDLGSCWMLTRDEVMSHRVQRVQGDDRYKTAIEMAYRFGSTDYVVLASGMGFPDALAAAPLAGTYGAPIILTPYDTYPSGFEKCLQDLGVKNVIIVGGTAVISPVLQDDLQNLGYSVTRIAGTNRFHTASLIAALVTDLNGRASHPAAEPFLVRGDAFADALAAAPFAWRERRPILLTMPGYAPQDTIGGFSYMNTVAGVDGVYVMGGTGAVSDDVLGDLWYNVTYPGDLYYLRIAGSDRYNTARAVVKDYWGWDIDNYAIASGETFPDALSAGPYMGKYWGALLLTPKAKLSSAAKNQLIEDREYIWDVVVAGGPGAVSGAAYDAIAPAIGSYHYDMDDYSGVVGTSDGVIIDTSLAGVAGAQDRDQLRTPLELRLDCLEREPGTYPQRNVEWQRYVPAE